MSNANGRTGIWSKAMKLKETRVKSSPLALGLLFYLLIPVSGYAQCRTPSNEKADRQNLDVLLSPGDSIRVSFFGLPEYLAEVDIEGDGQIKLPQIGDIRVASMTQSSAAHAIEQAYSERDFIKDPQVSVKILTYAVNGVSITGEVAKPGNYPITGPRTLLDIVAEAGGLTLTADTCVTIRHPDGATEERTMPREDAAATLNHDIPVRRGDRIVVARASMVYVVGDVAHPGGYLMQHDGSITVLQAIAMAGGTSRTSGEKNAVYLQRSADSYARVDLSIRALYQGQEHDFNLGPGDIIYVPASNVRNFVFNLPQIVGTLAGAAIYSVNR